MNEQSGETAPELDSEWMKQFFARCRINLAPVRTVRTWFPTSDYEVTFRITTEEEVVYLSFPISWRPPEMTEEIV
jgi:hypothetical protein